MKMPKNVWWFEVLLYASLTLDALSVDHTIRQFFHVMRT